MRACARILVVVALLVLGAACGGAARVEDGTTPARAAPPRRVVVLVPSTASVALPADDERELVTVDSPESAAARANAPMTRARQKAVAFENEAALEDVGRAQVILEQTGATVADFDALHECFALRALIESNLGHDERARAALDTAARLRPDRPLDEVQFPPDLRETYDAARVAARAESPAALSVTTDPPGAAVALDGRPVGESPLTLHATPGQHYVRVEALGRSPRVLATAFANGGSPTLHVALPPAPREELLRALVDAPREALGALDAGARQHLARTLDAEVVVVVTAVGDASGGASGGRAGDGDGGGTVASRATALDSGTGQVEAASLEGAGDPLGRLVAALDASRASVHADAGGDGGERDAGGEFVLESPWLWTIVGVVVVGAGAATAAVLLSQDPTWRLGARSATP